MANVKHYVGETGTEIKIDCNRDLTTAVNPKIFLKRPDDTVVEIVAEVYMQQYLRIFSDANTFTVPGKYEIQPYVEINNWKGRGKTVQFIIYDYYT
jgi:hypothetical protein